MSEIKKSIICADILDSYSIKKESLFDYDFLCEDNIYWLYAPVVIRKENENLIAGWSYVISEDGAINSSQAYMFGEGVAFDCPPRQYESSKVNDLHLKKVEALMNKNSNLMSDDIFKENFTEILRKYSVEIIIQSENYRIRIRPYLLQEISYDFFYDSVEDKMNVNVFNPQN